MHLTARHARSFVTSWLHIADGKRYRDAACSQTDHVDNGSMCPDTGCVGMRQSKHVEVITSITHFRIILAKYLMENDIAPPSAREQTTWIMVRCARTLAVLA